MHVNVLLVNGKLLGVFTKYNDALKISKEYDEDYCNRVEIFTNPVFINLDEYHEHNESEAKKKALAKLTLYEKQLLGIKE